MVTFVSTIFILIYSTDAAKERRDKSLTNIQCIVPISQEAIQSDWCKWE